MVSNQLFSYSLNKAEYFMFCVEILLLLCKCCVAYGGKTNGGILFDLCLFSFCGLDMECSALTCYIKSYYIDLYNKWPNENNK